MSDDQLGGPRRRDARGDHRHASRRPAATSAPASGTVELTVALHAELESPRDKIVWDVGPPGLRPQAAHRPPRRLRAPCASTAASAASCAGPRASTTSWARATPARRSATPPASPRPSATARREGRVVCVIGDGALTGGMAYEGLNQAGALGVADHRDPQRQRDEHLARTSARCPSSSSACASTRRSRGCARSSSAACRALPGASRRRRRTSATPRRRSGSCPGALFEALGFAYIGPDRRPRHRGVRRALRTTAREGPPGRDPRQDGQGPRLPAGRGRRRGDARRRPRSSSRAARRPAKVVRRRPELHRGLRPGAGAPRPSATRASSASPPPCSRAPGCST